MLQRAPSNKAGKFHKLEHTFANPVPDKEHEGRIRYLKKKSVITPYGKDK